MKKRDFSNGAFFIAACLGVLTGLIVGCGGGSADISRGDRPPSAPTTFPTGDDEPDAAERPDLPPGRD